MLLLLRKCHLTEPHIAQCDNGCLLPVGVNRADNVLEIWEREAGLDRPASFIYRWDTLRKACEDLPPLFYLSRFCRAFS